VNKPDKAKTKKTEGNQRAKNKREGNTKAEEKRELMPGGRVAERDGRLYITGVHEERQRVPDGKKLGGGGCWEASGRVSSTGGSRTDGQQLKPDGELTSRGREKNNSGTEDWANNDPQCPDK